MTTDTRPSASALLGRLREDEIARQSRPSQGDAAGRGPRGGRLLVRLGVATLLTLLTLVLSRLPSWAAGHWLQLVLATVVVAWSAWPVHASALSGLRRRTLTRDLPAGLGILTAYAWGAADVLAGRPPAYLWVAASVTAVVIADRVLEARAETEIREDLQPLMSNRADDVAVLRIDPRTRITGEIRIGADQLVVGDQFVVRTGEVVVADGGVVDGSATLDASRLLGDAPAVKVSVGDRVAGGAISAKGRLVIEARAVGESTLLARIQRLAEKAASGSTLSTPLDRAVDRASALVVPLTLLLALAALAGWLVTGSSRGLTVAISALVGASPAALSLAIPGALRVATGRSARLGVLVKGTEPLEQSRRVDTVALEQTGTVTTGDLRLRSIAVLGRLSKAAALKAAASVAAGSDEPVHRSIVAGARLARIELARITDFAANPGEGATARIKDTEVTLGRAELFDEVDDSLLDHAHQHGGHTLFVGWDGYAHAALTVEDVVRPTSRAGIEALQRLGLTAYLMSPEEDRGARRVAAQIGVEPGHVRAAMTPARERAFLADLQRQGRHVAFVGGGDTSDALEHAQLTVMMAHDTDVATDLADIVVLRPELAAVSDAIALSRLTRGVIRQNSAAAVAVNALVLVLAATGPLHPLLAALVGAVTSLGVLHNALRLKRFRR